MEKRWSTLFMKAGLLRSGESERWGRRVDGVRVPLSAQSVKSGEFQGESGECQGESGEFQGESGEFQGESGEFQGESGEFQGAPWNNREEMQGHRATGCQVEEAKEETGTLTQTGVHSGRQQQLAIAPSLRRNAGAVRGPGSPAGGELDDKWELTSQDSAVLPSAR
ncbi:hypothetical protein NHX12_011464, partial [Muraenolepis orangiensis]